jgi:hypothetical protein
VVQEVVPGGDLREDRPDLVLPGLALLGPGLGCGRHGLGFGVEWIGVGASRTGPSVAGALAAAGLPRGGALGPPPPPGVPGVPSGRQAPLLRPPVKPWLPPSRREGRKRLPTPDGNPDPGGLRRTRRPRSGGPGLQGPGTRLSRDPGPLREARLLVGVPHGTGPTLAEDLAQEAFVKAFHALGSYDPRYKFSSWLFKIANNLTIDHLRKRSWTRCPSTAPPTPAATRRRRRAGSPSRTGGRPRIGTRRTGARGPHRGGHRASPSRVPHRRPPPTRGGTLLRRGGGDHGCAPGNGEDLHPPGAERAEAAPGGGGHMIPSHLRGSGPRNPAEKNP